MPTPLKITVNANGTGNTVANLIALARDAEVTINGNGNASVTTGSGNDIIRTTGNSSDTINSGAGNDWINTGAGADNINAGSGDDTIIGGAGADVITGGLGADKFVFTSLLDSFGSATDLVTDFSSAQGDKFDLSAIDANANVAGDQAFVLTSAFTGNAGELIVTNTGINSYVFSVDTNGDSVADFSVNFNSAAPLVANDFFL